jgi:membrane protease subunit HflC
MISERNRIADQFRSEGQGEARKIEGDKERDLAEIQSNAFREAEEIKGRADAEATDIYASAYNKNRTAVDLYKFLRTMESFEKSMDENTSIILSSDSEFFKYLKKLN